MRTFSSLSTRAPRLRSRSAADRRTPTPSAARSTRPTVRCLYERLRQAAAAVPDVRSAALQSITPLTNSEWDTLIENPPGLSLPERRPDVYVNAVSPDFFATYGTPIAGRPRLHRARRPQRGEGHRRQRNVREEVLRRRQSRSGAGSATIRVPGRIRRSSNIVGVVRDAVYDSLRDAIPPTMYQTGAAGEEARTEHRRSRSAPRRDRPRCCRAASPMRSRASTATSRWTFTSAQADGARLHRAGAGDRDARRVLRRARAAARRHRSLRGDVVRRQPPPHGDRHPHGARRRSRERGQARPPPRRPARGTRRRRRRRLSCGRRCSWTRRCSSSCSRAIP